MTRELKRWDKLPMFSTLQEDMNRMVRRLLSNYLKVNESQSRDKDIWSVD